MVAARQRRIAAKTMAAIGIKPELKFFDTDLSFVFDRTAEVPTTGQLALIPQGDTQSTRDGRQAWIKSIQIQGSLTYFSNSSAPSSMNACLWLVLDTQANGAAAAITDVFTSNEIENALINLNNSGRFRILKKWVWSINPGAFDASGNLYNSVSKFFSFYKRCNIKIDWSSTTGAIGEIRSNNIFLMAGSQGNNADDTLTLDGVCRLRFMG